MKHLAEKLSVLYPDVLVQSNDQQVLHRAEAPEREYEDDLSPAFPMQMVCFRASIAGRNCKAPQHNRTGAGVDCKKCIGVVWMRRHCNGAAPVSDAACDCCYSREVLLKVEHNYEQLTQHNGTNAPAGTFVTGDRSVTSKEHEH